MTHPKAVATELLLVTDRPSFLADVRNLLGEPDGIRVGSLEAGPRLAGLAPCLAALEARGDSILVIDAETDPTSALLLVQEVFDHRPSPRVFVAGRASDPEMILRAQRAGAAEFLPLPLDRRILLDAILRARKRLSPETHPGGAPRRGRVLTFLGSKGGCGATTVATNLAVILASGGQSTLLVDLDLTAGDVALLLNLSPTFTVADVVQNAHRLDRDLLNGMIVRHESGLEVLAASENPDRALEVDPGKIAQVLNFLKGQFDSIVVSARNVWDPPTQAALNQGDLIHLVTSLDLLSLRRAQWALRRMAQFGIARDLLRVVVNHHDKNPFISLEEAEKILDLKVSWTIPSDPRSAQEALNGGIPFVSQSRNGLLGSFQSYAARFAGASHSPPVKKPGPKILGLFSRRRLKTQEGDALA